MLRHHRRWWVVVVMLLLATPMLAMLLPLSAASGTHDEDRALALPPGLPTTAKDWGSFPRRVDDYLQDHFGLRRILVLANGLIRDNVGNGNDAVFVGRGGHLYYRSDDTLEQSAGVLNHGRWPWLASTADMLAEMQRILGPKGVKILVASPPNASTMEQRDLPGWARLQTRPTEYDHFLTLLAERGITAIDLRPVLADAARNAKSYYRHDTHWTPYGALRSFDAIAAADGHPDWEVPPSVVKPAARPLAGGDLARLLGVASVLSEPEQEVDLPATADRRLLRGGQYQTFVETAPHPGPTIMVIGDSFTDSYFLLPLLQHAGRIVWTHAQLCGFDWRWITQYRPAEIWYMPTERLLPCPPGTRPAGMPRPAAAPAALLRDAH